MVGIKNAAYVPFDDETAWDDAAALAVEWVEQRCEEEDAAGLLVTHTVDGAQYTPALVSFVQRNCNHATPRSRTTRRNTGPGPVLVYVPDPGLLYFASGLARNSSLCAVGSGSFDLSGWAAATRAVNLATGDEAPPVSEDVERELKRLSFYGNNGWGDPFGKKNAKLTVSTLLVKLSDRDDVKDFIVGWTLANGASDNGAKNLAKVIDRLR